MTLESDAVAGATIELLESRLRRISYLLTGDSHWTGEPSLPLKPDNLDETVSRRLLRLEKDLEKLGRRIPAIYDVIQLRTSSLNSFPPWQITNVDNRRPLSRPLPRNTPRYPPRNPNNPKPRLNCPLLRLRLPRNRLPPHIPQ